MKVTFTKNFYFTFTKFYYRYLETVNWMELIINHYLLFFIFVIDYILSTTHWVFVFSIENCRPLQQEESEKVAAGTLQELTRSCASRQIASKQIYYVLQVTSYILEMNITFLRPIPYILIN